MLRFRDGSKVTTLSIMSKYSRRMRSLGLLGTRTARAPHRSDDRATAPMLYRERDAGSSPAASSAGYAFAGDEIVDALAEALDTKILLGRRLALVDFLRPLLERQLDAEGLVDREGDVEEGQGIDAEIFDLRLCG